MTNRHTRYQGLIVRDHHMLLIQHGSHTGEWSHWVIPGGGMESGESPEECIVREMKEETNLVVSVERLLVDEPDHPDSAYQRRKTYLCRILSGKAAPGYEPELEASSVYAITAVRWLDLRDESGWEKNILEDIYTYPQLEQFRELLGYKEGTKDE